MVFVGGSLVKFRLLYLFYKRHGDFGLLKSARAPSGNDRGLLSWVPPFFHAGPVGLYTSDEAEAKPVPPAGAPRPLVLCHQQAPFI